MIYLILPLKLAVITLPSKKSTSLLKNSIGYRMYETDHTGWTRTPEELNRLKSDKRYRFKMNRKWLYISIFKSRWGIGKYYFSDIWYNLKNTFLNKNNF